ncbi:uncharacterized protein [Anoplolepis gracilipes]|uniref:uncharacterized protein isoform X3 n=1 Tax=Anoplolepis gracilipes TaxID=354296 RepID=UPI003BA13D61
MSIQKSEDLLSVVIPAELSPSPNSQELFINQDQQDEEASDCPLLTPSPPPIQTDKTPQLTPIFNALEGASLETIPTPTLENINTEDGLNYMNIVNSSSKPLNDEPSSRDPMVESTSSGSSSDTNEPACAQLLTQLNTAYQHLAPDAQALFYNQENGGKPPLVGIQLVVPKPPKDYRFMKWNWSLIRKTCYWTLMSILIGCAALVVGIIATMPKRCDPPVEWWQGSTFYEIFPASFQDSIKGADGIGDLRGIIMRLDYLKGLGVQAIRLNSIFPASHYPEYYSEISNMMDVNKDLGTLEDFSALVREIQKRNMSIVLDLPLYPFVKNLSNQAPHIRKVNGTEWLQDRQDPVNDPVREPSAVSTSVETIRTVLTSIPPPLKITRREIPSSSRSNHQQEDSISEAIKIWQLRGVNGFYLQGLEHYVNEDTFIGIEDCECQDHKDLAHVHNLVPMYWEKKDSASSSFSPLGITTWLPEAEKPMETSLTGTIKEMARLRTETTPIYVKAVLREGQSKANCGVRYVEDEMIVIERWYPRRNSYVLVANFGNVTRMKDLSFLYYGGHVVIGPTYRMNRDVYFKELTVPPGEAFVIKLDK